MIYICTRGNQYAYLDEENERTLWCKSIEEMFLAKREDTTYTLQGLKKQNGTSVQVMYTFKNVDDIKDKLPEYYL